MTKILDLVCICRNVLMKNDDLEIQEVKGEATRMTAGRKNPKNADVPLDVSHVITLLKLRKYSRNRLSQPLIIRTVCLIRTISADTLIDSLY